MKSSTKQRLFWCVSALLIAAVLFSFVLLNAGKSGNPVNTVAETLDENLEIETALSSDQKLFVGLSIGKLTHVFLFILLGFCLYHLFAETRIGILLALGTGVLFSAMLEVCHGLLRQDARWQDAMIHAAAAAAGAGIAVLAGLLFAALKKWYDGENPKRLRHIETLLDSLALAAVLHYAVFRFLQNTMFVFNYSEWYKTITLLLMILAGGIRFMYLILKKYWHTPEARDKSFMLLRCIFVFSLAMPFVLVGFLHDYKLLVFLPFAALCLYDMKSETIFRSFTLTIGTLLAATVLCCLSGTVKNLVLTGHRIVGAYGTINSTDFASYFSFLLLTAWCGMKNRKWYVSVTFAALTVILSYMIYLFTESRTILFVGSLTALFVLWECLEENTHGDKKVFRRIDKGIGCLSVFAFPLIGVSVVIIVAAYSQEAPWALHLDEMLSQRLRLTLDSYLTYGIHPLGNTIESMLGNGRTIIRRLVSGYSYLDIAYAMLAIRYGWIVTAIVAGLWVWLTARAIKSGRKRMAFAMAVLAVHAFSEARFLDLNYNIFLVMPFCALAPEEKKEEAEAKKDRMHCFPAVACIVMLGGVYLALPTVLSWLRSFFALMHWNRGGAAFGSLVVCVAIVVLLGLLWKAVSMLWMYRSKKAFVLLVCTVLPLTGGALAINGVIERGIGEQTARIAAEEQTIRTVQQAAVMPVYAAEASELYQRRIGGFAGHIFSTEELGRAPQGSIFVDRSVDAMTITESGGQYVQISDWSGLYSYDPAVIEALEHAGYIWQNFYTGKTTCDLKEAAQFNGIKAEETPVLRGPIRFATQNMEIDHVPGVYVVSFTVSSPIPLKNGEVALLEVLTDDGARTILQNMLTAADFDGQGRCTYSMLYKISSAPRLFFAISVAENASVTVEEITVQRIAQRVEIHDGVNHLVSPADNSSAWIKPSNFNTKDFRIATLVLRDKKPGDAYTCHVELEFRNAAAVEDKTFVLYTAGAVDESRKIENIWTKKLINLKTAPEDGVYQYTSINGITDSNLNATDFNIDFHCENWAGGTFRVNSIVIEKSQFITAQPSSVEVNEGEDATFMVEANGAIAYQWYYQKPGETNWTMVKHNGSSATYILTTAARHNGYKYRCMVSNDTGYIWSNTVELTLNLKSTD